MKKSAIFLAFSLATLGMIVGCGYGLVGTGSALPKNVRTISIPTFTNTSKEPGIERKFTQVVREEFIKDGRLKVIDSRKTDWRLSGGIKDYYLKPVSFDANDNVTAYWIEMTLFVKLTDNRSKKNIFEQQFHPLWDYRVTSEVSLTNIRRQEGIENAAKDFAKTLISLIIEGF